jgi:cell fate regulator YaaT (PSP1 superfamily)
MPDIVGIRFKKAGQLNYFNAAGIALKVGDQVVVETARGLELGIVVIPPRQTNETTEPLKSVLRLASAEDISKFSQLEEREREALVRCREAVGQLGLPMKLLTAEYNLDASRLTVYFCAQGRVDFRGLVRQLASTLQTRVELRQVGTRDEAKLCGRYGHCGRPLCCVSFMTEFAPVSIKMAKEQDLPLNPPKISGLCGRLLCCLAYEYDFYHTTKEKLPKAGKRVNTPMGPATVLWVSVIKQTVMVQVESQAVVELPLDQINAEGQAAQKAPARSGKAKGSSQKKAASGRKDSGRSGTEGQELEPL